MIKMMTLNGTRFEQLMSISIENMADKNDTQWKKVLRALLKRRNETELEVGIYLIKVFLEIDMIRDNVARLTAWGMKNSLFARIRGSACGICLIASAQKQSSRPH